MVAAPDSGIPGDRVLPKEPDKVLKGDLNEKKARAHWLSRRRLAWRVTAEEIVLHASKKGHLHEEEGQVKGAEQHWPLQLVKDHGSLAAHPYLEGCSLFEVPEVDARELCRCQLAVSLSGDLGVQDCSGVQIGPLLDELFRYDGPLGCQPLHGDRENGVELALWAPTALAVEVLVAEGPKVEVKEVKGQAAWRKVGLADDGVWRCQGPADWWGRFYLYRITAHFPSGLYTTITPDPYSTACAADASWSLMCHLATWKEVLPDGEAWRQHPFTKARAEAAVYELHVRDFSMSDPAVPEQLRGKYLAFTLNDTLGDRHLRALAGAGISHVQLLPTYDFGTVPERVADRQEPSVPQAEPNSERQQQAVVKDADHDSFNWGYDPVLYNVPEGSYATDPDNSSRIKEFREMVASLHRRRLGVVLDVVFNHTLESGPSNPLSVLDKCVPGYYHRRAEDGTYEASTCMNNTATERYMMARLVCDSVLHWATQYHVDGFRFDLMGHITLDCMRRVRDSLDSLSMEVHGIHGPKILLYGEGWEFGEVAENRRGAVAVQRCLGGSGLGAFNDRLRDAALGGSPFVDPRLQGFCTGLCLRPAPGVDQGTELEQETRLLKAQDTLRLSLAGSLKAYELLDYQGKKLRGDLLFEEKLAYTEQPVEAINYVSAHDNETLFDNTVWKMLPGSFTPQERMRGNWLATSLVALAHGVPFFHAGDELLRSKSLDRDSYNSSDWFNVLDFSGATNAFGRGLPPQSKNGHHWELMKPILQDASVRPTVEMVEASKAKFLELLQIRGSTSLIGLVEAADILEHVDFPGSGPMQTPGLIVMQTCNGGKTCTEMARVVIVWWAGFSHARVPVPQAHGIAGRQPLRLHPLQASSRDPVIREARVEGDTLVVPPQSTAVFVEPID